MACEAAPAETLGRVLGTDGPSLWAEAHTEGEEGKQHQDQRTVRAKEVRGA